MASRKRKQTYSKEQRAARSERSGRWRRENLPHVAAREAVRRRTKPGIVGGLWTGAKKRARMFGIEFSITQADIFVPPLCPLLCIPLFVGNGRNGPNSPTLDRIRPELGYVPGNVWVISHKANRIKTNATVAEIVMLARNLEMLVALDGGNDGL